LYLDERKNYIYQLIRTAVRMLSEKSLFVYFKKFERKMIQLFVKEFNKDEVFKFSLVCTIFQSRKANFK